ncbi:uncharacterized protein K452DRAFT_292578 [Aplosporella prunicola CBS 121167]|uniref:Methyltransferase domain-containing protein n=1 Tax=Aplosporella prunicola CBS 121167 TaxID=1176127 RepID=A0A6A6AYE3_9PEZI|nr:uncharacterized protein K452DRAFT_292578 [Aplosporella prunicola CBS 121167]KAF2136203.1 hypothetical protein K452DRAFT_292578 [Aplosporella prunicola CBS 121167]
MMASETSRESESDYEDSSLGSDAESSLHSLESWVEKDREENGRRYHSFKDGAYLMPNDEHELDRLDLHHHVTLLMMDDKLHFAPLESPHRVLDVGTGTGIWAIDFADLFPAASVIGTDLSPVQPKWVPPNLEFQIDDAEDEWTFHDKFDYIHIRSMAGSFGDWNKLLAQAFANLNPGGYVEIQEHEAWYNCYDDSLEKAPNIMNWMTKLREASEKIGKPFLMLNTLAKTLENVGFVDVNQTIMEVPTGPWKEDKKFKLAGMYQREQMIEAASAYGTAHFTRVLGWSLQEYQVLSSRVRKEMRNEDLRLWSKLYVVHARKPA